MPGAPPWCTGRWLRRWSWKPGAESIRQDGKRLLRWNLHGCRCRCSLDFTTHQAMAPSAELLVRIWEVRALGGVGGFCPSIWRATHWFGRREIDFGANLVVLQPLLIHSWIRQWRGARCDGICNDGWGMGWWRMQQNCSRRWVASVTYGQDGVRVTLLMGMFPLERLGWM